MKLRHLNIIILLFCCSVSKANTVISGQIFNCNKTVTADYFPPFGHFYNQFDDNRDIKINRDHSFCIDLQLDSSGFIILNFPGKTYFLFIQPGDKINLQLYYSQDQNKKWFVSRTLYSGNNSAGHRIFNSYGPFLHSMDLIRNIVFGKIYTSATQVFDKSAFLIDSLLQPFNTLFKSNKISSTYFAYVSTELRVSVSIFVLTIFNYYVSQSPVEMALENDKRTRIPYFLNTGLYNEPNYIQLKKLFYQTIPPGDPTILSTSLGDPYLSLYYSDLLTQTITGSGNNLYDSAFNAMDSGSRFLGYLSGSSLEMCWASALHWEVTSDTSEERILKSYTLFSRRYPDSRFLPGLTERIGLTENENSNDTHQAVKLNIIKAGKYRKLDELITANFKDEYVFVDLWATWCVPCIEQFTFKNKLEEFLGKENIATLYISIDSKSNEKKWENLIHLKKLNGSHYLVDEELLGNIGSVVYKKGQITIPRYLLANKKGILVSTNLPRPSDLNLLEIEIKRLKSTQ
jgi:thiol-disulfide isomerase/thioredoxin